MDRNKCGRCGTCFDDDNPGLCVMSWFWYCGLCCPPYWLDFAPVFRSKVTVSVVSEER